MGEKTVGSGHLVVATIGNPVGTRGATNGRATSGEATGTNGVASRTGTTRTTNGPGCKIMTSAFGLVVCLMVLPSMRYWSWGSRPVTANGRKCWLKVKLF